MATRTILTSQPVLQCDVCERSLLRGEQHDVFLQAGQPRTVCELCAPRAAQVGWLRERDSHLDALAPPRRRRGRTFIERLRELASPAAEPGAGPARAMRAPAESEPSEQPTEEWLFGEAPPDEVEILQRAAAAFNASEFPRRAAGLSRSLGAPAVNVRIAEHLPSAVRVVLSWELCWYRYEVDLSEQPAVMRALAQGSELSQLEHDERVGNASLSPSGELALTSPA